MLHSEALRRDCLLCREPTWDLSRLCTPCLADLPWNTAHCQQCALPITVPLGLALHCGECLKSPAPFDRIIAPFRYDFPVDRMLHQFKYQGKRHWSKRLAALMAAHIHHLHDTRQLVLPEILIPVPLHRKRLRERTYNQSDLLARQLGRMLDLPVDRQWLTKTQPTRTQAGLTKTERLRNLRDAFTLKGNRTYQHIALIDDVVTTRATVEAIARQLRKNGVTTIEVWVLARTPRK
jgi:ComF family protein